MEKVEKYKQSDGTEVDITIKTLGFRQRNNLFKEYLDLNRFMKAANTDNTDILEFVKEDKSVLDFMTEILVNGIPTITIDNLESSEGDELFEKYSAYILTGDATKN